MDAIWGYIGGRVHKSHSRCGMGQLRVQSDVGGGKGVAKVGGFVAMVISS